MFKCVCLFSLFAIFHMDPLSSNEETWVNQQIDMGGK